MVSKITLKTAKGLRSAGSQTVRWTRTCLTLKSSPLFRSPPRLSLRCQWRPTNPTLWLRQGHLLAPSTLKRDQHPKVLMSDPAKLNVLSSWGTSLKKVKLFHQKWVSSIIKVRQSSSQRGLQLKIGSRSKRWRMSRVHQTSRMLSISASHHMQGRGQSTTFLQRLKVFLISTASLQILKTLSWMFARSLDFLIG